MVAATSRPQPNTAQLVSLWRYVAPGKPDKSDGSHYRRSAGSQHILTEGTNGYKPVSLVLETRYTFLPARGDDQDQLDAWYGGRQLRCDMRE